MTPDESLERDLKAALAGRGARPCPGEAALLAFYRGRLSETESESIRGHLGACAACVEVARDARAFLGAVEPASQRSRPSGYAWLAAAAVAAAALLAGLWLARHRFAGPPSESSARTAPAPVSPWRDLSVAAADYRAVAPEDELAFRSGEGAAAAGFAEAMVPYARGDYAAADAALGRYLEAQPHQPEASFYRGVSLLMLGRPEEARPLLAFSASAVPAPGEARWYLALALLKSGATAAAVADLDAVASSPGPHRAEAGKLAAEVRSVVQER